jgi:DNA-binding CsgD family transcriptional regulator
VRVRGVVTAAEIMASAERYDRACRAEYARRGAVDRARPTRERSGKAGHRSNEPAGSNQLTPAQIDALRRIRSGQSQREIATELGREYKSIGDTITRARIRLDLPAGTRRDVVALVAAERGLLGIAEVTA